MSDELEKATEAVEKLEERIENVEKKTDEAVPSSAVSDAAHILVEARKDAELLIGKTHEQVKQLIEEVRQFASSSMETIWTELRSLKETFLQNSKNSETSPTNQQETAVVEMTPMVEEPPPPSDQPDLQEYRHRIF